MSNFSWKLQEFDTEIFGFKVAKITSLADSEESVKSLIKDLEEKDITYATYRFPIENFKLIHLLEKHGFRLVDVYVNLRLDLDDSIKSSNTEPNIREATKEDLEELRALGGKVFSLNRLYNDPFILKGKADKFYAKWVENSVLGKAADLVLVWEESKKVVGFITLQKKGHIPLVGVSEKQRGKGIAKKLTLASFEYFQKWEAESVEIETQLNNIAALRSYAGCGFKIIGSQITFRWTKENV